METCTLKYKDNIAYCNRKEVVLTDLQSRMIKGSRERQIIVKKEDVNYK